MKFVSILALVVVLFFAGSVSADWAITACTADGYGDQSGGVIDASGTYTTGAGELITLQFVVYSADRSTLITSFDCHPQNDSFLGGSRFIPAGHYSGRAVLLYTVNMDTKLIQGDWIDIVVP